jgi:glycosyltransferase involved in cell wall biosynthesis
MNPIPVEKRRVLFAVRYLWGDEGITTQLMALTERLRARGWDIGLITGIESEQLENHPNLKWLVRHTKHFNIPFPDHFDLTTLYQTPWIAHKILHIIRSFHPSVIQLFSLSLTPYFFILRPFGTRYISRLAIEPDPDRKDVKIGSFLTRLFNNYMGDRVIAISSDMVSPIQDTLNVPNERVHVIFNGIDASHFRPPSVLERQKAKANFNINSDENVICIVGRLDWIKGHDVLFRAIHELRAAGHTPVVLCAGTGGHEQRIIQLADSLGITDQVRFLGYTDSRTVYWASDILVLPSRREGFANVIVEGMLCETVPIRTPGAGASDQINHGQNGFIIPFDAPDELANRIRHLFEHPQKMKRMGQNARTLAKKHFSLQVAIDNTEKLYKSMIASTEA